MSPTPDYSVLHYDPPTKAQMSAHKRRRWVTITLVISILAVGIEAYFHVCASLLFDPLPDIATGVGYIGVIFCLWFNEVVLLPDQSRKSNPLLRGLGPKRATGLALAGTPVALLVAGMATWMFLPFLPVAPPLALTGVGLLLSAPFLAFLLLIIQMRALRRLWQTHAGASPDGRVSVGAVFIGAAALFFLIVRPALIGHWTMQALRSGPSKRASQQKAFAGLRFLRGQETMLDLTYRRNPPYWVSFGYQVWEQGPWPWAGYAGGAFARGGLANAETARRTYFLMTGSPYESVPRPASATRQSDLSGPDEVAVEETGGMGVGRPVPGLALAQSNLEFTSDSATETGDGTWTMTFANHTGSAQEARADILLPPGAVCHAVSLWVNGVEKPAAFGAPQKVRAAYREVAVVHKRDPLLVTMPAPGHLLVQCFPVPAQGRMKIKIGITTPLTGASGPMQAPALSLTLPAFGPVNFEIPPSVRNEAHFYQRGLSVQGSLSCDVFTPSRYPVFSPPGAAPRKGEVLASGVVRQSDPFARPAAPADIWVLADASEGMNALFTPETQTILDDTLAALPAGSRVFIADTGSGEATLVSDRRPSLLIARRLPFTGGVDPAPSLAALLKAARTEKAATHRASVVLFFHAASPAHVSNWSETRHELQQADAPALVSVQMAPRAFDTIATELSGFARVWATRALPGPDSIATLTEVVDLAHQSSTLAPVAPAEAGQTPLGGHLPAINGVWLAPSAATTGATDATPLSRLGQASLTTAHWFRANQTAAPGAALDLRIAGGQPAAAARLVTVLSSAVVLETHAQYARNGLDTKNGKKGYANAKSAPDPDPHHPEVNMPEPPSVLLLALGSLAGIGLLRRWGR